MQINKFFTLSLIAYLTLCQMGASCDSELNRMTPRGDLHKASMAGDIDTIKRLVGQEGRSVNEADETGNTPMHVAAYYGKIDAIKTLKTLGADINPKDRTKGRTPLHVAAAQSFWTTDYEEVLNTLIDLGADINAQDTLYSQTALHRASYWGIKGNVKTLLSRGANKMIRNSQNRTALEVAQDRINSIQNSSKHGESNALLENMRQVQIMLQ